MKTEEMMVLGLAALAVWFITKAKTSSGAQGTRVANFDNAGGQLITEFQNWKYYTGGVVIDPDGAYWLNGVKVWSPS